MLPCIKRASVKAHQSFNTLEKAECLFLSVIFLPFWAHCYIWRGHFPGGVFHVFVLSLESTKDSSISCLFLRHAHKTSTSERLLAKVAQPGRGVNNSLRCGGSCKAAMNVFTMETIRVRLFCLLLLL